MANNFIGILRTLFGVSILLLAESKFNYGLGLTTIATLIVILGVISAYKKNKKRVIDPEDILDHSINHSH